MLYFSWMVGLYILVAFLAYKRATLSTFTLAAAIWLGLGSLVSIIGELTWFIFLIVIIILNVKSIRQSVMIMPLFSFYKKAMPQLSSTEKEALNAGTTWWETDLFRGQPDWQKLHNIPPPRLSPEEQHFLDGPVETVCAMVNDWQTTHHDADLSPEVWQYLKDNKFFALIIKKEFGGLEFSAYAQSQILQKLMGTSTVLTVTVGVPNSLGPAELIQHYGTKEQQDHYLANLATGQEIPCFALTSPEAGSDAGAIPDVGIVCKKRYQGKDIIGVSLTFNKRYITLAPIATVIGLAVKLSDPKHLLGEQTALGITCFLLPRDTKGLDIGRRHHPLDVPFQNGPIRGDNIFVPLDFIIGGQKMIGQGWRMLVECLSVGRAITLPSNAVGAAKAATLATGAYARIRRQFKLPIGKMQGVEEALARMGGNTYLMDATASLSTTGIDLGEKPSVISAIAKYHLTEKMRTVVCDAMDVQGGKAIMLGPNNIVGRGYQSLPIAITVEGANILTRNMIIYGQGSIRCHPYILAELDALELIDEVESLNAFDQAICGHIGFVISNKVRAYWHAFTNGKASKAPFNDFTQPYYQQLTRLSSALALTSDICMAVLGGSLKREERVSARLGDLLSYLYLASACLKRYQDEGRQSADKCLVDWAMQDSLYRCEQALIDLLNNFPIRWLGKSLKLALVPWGATNKKPSDLTEHEIAQLVQTPSEARSRLGQNQYVHAHENNLLGQFESALKMIIKAEPIYDAICSKLQNRVPFMHLDQLAEQALADQIINEHEADILIAAEHARLDIINVDDFAAEELIKH